MTCFAAAALAGSSRLLLLDYLDGLAVAAVQNAQTGCACVGMPKRPASLNSVLPKKLPVGVGYGYDELSGARIHQRQLRSKRIGVGEERRAQTDFRAAQCSGIRGIGACKLVKHHPGECVVVAAAKRLVGHQGREPYLIKRHPAAVLFGV